MKKIFLILFLSILSFSDYKKELMLAVKKDKIDEIITLDKKYNINISDNLNNNMLLYAINNNSNKAVNYLIKKYPHLINKIGEDKFLPLEAAVLNENEYIINLLLENGAIIRKKDGNGNTVYDLATRFGKGKIVKILRDYELKNEKK